MLNPAITAKQKKKSPVARMGLLLFAFWICTSSSQNANAYLTSDFDANLGFSSFGVNVSDAFSGTLESPTTFDFSYNLNMSAWQTAFSISFTEMIQSNMGNMAYTRIGAGFRYYLLGLNGQRLVIDNEAGGKIWRPSPFAGLTAGIATIGVVVEDVPQDKYFNASVFDLTAKAGTEIPLGSGLILLGQFHYTASMGLMAISDNSKRIVYNGFGIFAGLRLTSFD